MDSIPVEVLVQVASYLTTPEYGNLRLTSKWIDLKLFDSFSREYFTKRQFMFTKFSLQTLVDISKSRFSHTLSYIIFGLERPGHSILTSLPSAMDMALNPQAHIKYNRILQEYTDHLALLKTAHDVEMLTEAFSNLSNLNTIGMRDFNNRRYRDFTEWKSYGLASYELETGTRFDQPRPFYASASRWTASSVPSVPNAAGLSQASYLSLIFLNAIRALGKSGSQAKNFEVILRKVSLHDHAFDIPKYLETTTDPVLSNLRTLFLDLNSDLPAPQVSANGAMVECSSYFLRKFLSKVSNLEHLRLNFNYQAYQSREAKDLLLWLSRPSLGTSSTNLPGPSYLVLPPPSGLFELPPPIELPKLQQLDIGMLTIEPKILLDIILKFRATLRSISFHKVSLLQSDIIASDRVNEWVKLFGKLKASDLKLRSINLSFLTQEQPNKAHIRLVTFDDSTKDPRVRKWGGQDVQSGLRDYIMNTKVKRFDEDTETESSEDEGNPDDDGVDVIMLDDSSDSSDE